MNRILGYRRNAAVLNKRISKSQKHFVLRNERPVNPKPQVKGLGFCWRLPLVLLSWYQQQQQQQQQVLVAAQSRKLF